jgi:hypothetical protein
VTRHEQIRQWHIEGRINAGQHYMLLCLIDDLDEARRRRRIRDALLLGPLRRWVRRKLDFPRARLLP